MDVFKLQASLGLNTEEYERALKAAVSQAEALTKNMQQLTATSDSTDAAITETGKAAEDESKSAKKAAEQTKKLSNSLEETGKNSDDAANKLKEASGKLKGDLAAAAKVGGAAFAATSALIIKSTKDAVENFAQYEQLVGGVETLFKDSADRVQKYAENAYKTAGLSANAYMETVTSFSASLLQGLNGDTAKAADVADLAIRDMSDNANKMGTAMESIQNAYQGFSKQNYMMLDNLKLGYGGTKTEMERLLADAEKLSGIHYEIGNYADMIEAIHVIQTEMGITGTTAKEAATTIEGSANAAKATWQNLLTGFGRDNADIDKLVDEVVDSVTQLGKNVLPVAERAFTSLSKTAMRESAKLAKQLPDMIEGAAVEVRKTISEEFGVSTDSIIATETAIKAAAGAFVAYKAAVVATDAVQGIVTLTQVIQGATTAQEALNAAGMANPYILIATAVTTATVALKSYIDAQAEMIDVAGETYNNLTEEQKALMDSSDELHKSITDDIQAVDNDVKSVDTEAGALEKMKNELYELNDVEKLNNEQKAEMKVKVDALNQAIPSLNLELDKQTGHLKNQKEAIDAVIDSYAKQARAQAAQNKLVKLNEDLLVAEEKRDKLAAQRTEKEKELNRIKEEQKRLENEIRNFKDDGTNESIDRYAGLRQALEALNEEERKTENAQGDLAEAWRSAAVDVDDLNTKIDETGRIAAEANGATDLLAENTTEATSKMDSAWTLQGRTMKTLMSDLKDYVMVVGGETYNISQETYDEIQEISNSYRELLADQEENISRSLDLFSEFNGGAAVSSQDLINNLNANAEELDNWAARIQELANRGINEGLLKELEEAGPASASKVKALTEMSDTELQNYSDKWAETKDRIHAIAEEQTLNAKTQAEESIGKMIGVAEDNKDNAAAAYEDLGRYMTDGAGGAIKDGTSKYVIPVTQQMVEGMVKQYDDSLAEADIEGHGGNVPQALGDGIRKHEEWALRAIDDLVRDMEQRYINDTQEHSPPKLFKDHAALIPVAMEKGIESSKNKAVGAMEDLVQSMGDVLTDQRNSGLLEIDPEKDFIKDRPSNGLVKLDKPSRKGLIKLDPKPKDGNDGSLLVSEPSKSDSNDNSGETRRSSRRDSYGGSYGYSIERPLTINLVLRNGEAFARFVAPYLDLINAESVTLQQGGAAW